MISLEAVGGVDLYRVIVQHKGKQAVVKQPPLKRTVAGKEETLATLVLEN